MHTQSRCGIVIQETWYTSAARCNKVVDYDAAVWVYGGCQYDHPVGGCSNMDVTENSIGYAVLSAQEAIRITIHVIHVW